MGASVNKYINGYKIILSSIFVNQNGDGPDNMYIEFTHTGQYVKLLSFINKTYQSYGYKNKYWQILTGSYSLYSFNDLTTVPLITYSKILNIDPNNINIVDLSKSLSILDLNITVLTNIYVVIQLIKNGFHKRIIFRQSINTYISTKNIILFSKFYDKDTNTVKYLNLSFNLSGQILDLISVHDTISNNTYWKIISNDHSINTTNVEHLFQNYVTNFTNTYYINNQTVDLSSTFNIDKDFYYISIDSQLNSDKTYLLPNIEVNGIQKKYYYLQPLYLI